MQKNFDSWNEKKKVLEEMKKDFFFHEAEVWWCAIGLNVQSESCGKGENYQRPVLILKKLSGSSFIGIPLSSQNKVGSWFVEISMHNEKRYALLYQIRMFSTNRFQRRLATLDTGDFKRVKEKLGTLLELFDHHQAEPGSVGNPKSDIIIAP
jgi:mRNA interferase MazF